TDNGIDVENDVLKVTKPNGTVLTGAQAVHEVRTDPKLTAAFVGAGADTDVQAVQIEMSKKQKIDADGLNQRATVTVNGHQYTFTARDIFKSDYGAAVVANAGVHAGPGNVRGRLQAGLQDFFKNHPNADPTKPDTWRAQAEQDMLSRMIGGDAGRAKAFRDA